LGRHANVAAIPSEIAVRRRPGAPLRAKRSKNRKEASRGNTRLKSVSCARVRRYLPVSSHTPRKNSSSIIVIPNYNLAFDLTRLSERLQLSIDLLDTFRNRPPTAPTKKNDIAFVTAVTAKF
jgi:hypothetical protein